MQEVDSDALKFVSKILRLSGTGSQETNFQDEVLQQTLDVLALVRRAGTPVLSTGIFTATILNTHVGSDTINTDVNPYSPGTTFVGNGYPAEVPANLDVWLLHAHAQGITGTGDFGGGQLSTIMDALGMGWRNEANAIAMLQPIMSWDVERTEGSLVFLYSNQNDVLLFSGRRSGGIRIPRHADTRIRFTTVKNGAGAGTFKAFLTLGLFPAGLGQDGTA